MAPSDDAADPRAPAPDDAVIVTAASSPRELMRRALAEVVLPRLRALGFGGSMPHLRRPRADRIDLLSFQFDRRGGGFVVEIAQCPPDGLTTPWGARIAPGRVRAWDLPPSGRARVRPGAGSGTESWFRYDGCETGESFRLAAESALPYVEQAAMMLDDFGTVRKMESA